MTTDPHELRDRIDVLAQRFERAGRARQDRYSGAAADGVVRVDLDAEGGLIHLQVGADWREVLNAPDLGHAILEAIGAAQVQRTIEWGRETEDAGEESLRARPLPVFESDLATQVAERLSESQTQPDAEVAMNALAESLREMRDSLRAVRRDLQDVGASELRGVSDNSRTVEVTMRGTGEITDIRLDQRWLERAHPANINRLVLAAVEDARKRLAGRTTSDIVQDSRLAELVRQLNDPDYIADRLRR